ncbi:hypothetical protein N8491_03290 [Akkermansiaceae bacterium]|nr:hypothetical protein [Akkermansiaceae bacterium]
MKKLSLALSLAFGATALADVPALINYQGRLVDGVGNPIVGKKEFKLDIYDSQTEGTLIYQETLADIELDEDGAYSFQFGAGESRSETSVLVATGDGEAAFFQKVFEETPVGVISVTDGTNTFKTGDIPTGEEPFSFTYTASLKRLNLVCNEPPAEGTKFTATFRYAESGIIGALGSAAEHWMEVTIGGEKQEPRQRLVAVPFALRAGVAREVEAIDSRAVDQLTGTALNIGSQKYRNLGNYSSLTKVKLNFETINDANYPDFSIVRANKKEVQDWDLGYGDTADINLEVVWESQRLQEGKLVADSGAIIKFEDYGKSNSGQDHYIVTIEWVENIVFDQDYYYFWNSNRRDPYRKIFSYTN